MKAIVDVNKIRNNIREKMNYKLFNWIDIRNNFYNYGLDVLEDILKFERIGLVTDDLKVALKIRNVDKKIPILLTNIQNQDQVFDIIMNDLILSVDNMDLYSDICNLELKDTMQIAIRIDINNFEDGISVKNYQKIRESLKTNKNIIVNLIYAKVNCPKYNDLKQFETLVNSEQISSFVIGQDAWFTSDGFISKEIFEDATEFKLTINKCYKLTKGMMFVNTKIKKDCYGIKIIAQNVDLANVKKIMIDNFWYKTVFFINDTLFLIGKNSVKANKSISIPDGAVMCNASKVPYIYKINDKTLNYSIFK